MPKFTKQEYIKELRELYNLAREQKDIHLSFSVLQSLSIISGVGRQEIRQQIKHDLEKIKQKG